MENNTQEFISRKQLAAMLGVTQTAVYQWQRAGRLNPVRLGRRCVRYRRAEVEAMIAAASGSNHAAQAQ